MAKIRQLTAFIEREGDGYVALCPELDVASQGNSVEEAGANLAEAVELFFETASAHEVKDRSYAEVYYPRRSSRWGGLRVLSGKEVCRILATHGFVAEED